MEAAYGRPSFALAALMSLVCVSAAAAQPYTIIGIAPPPGYFGVLRPVAINNSRQVVLSGESGTFVYDAGTLIPVGTLGGSRSVAYGINDHGEVVGESETGTGIPQGFIWDRLHGIRAHIPSPANASTLRDIDNHRRTVGVVHHGTLPYQVPGDGVLYVGDSAFDLGKIADYDSTYPEAISDATHVAGTITSVECCSGRRRAFVWDAARGLHALGTFGGPHSMAEDINVLGQAVGHADGPAEFCYQGQCLYSSRAFLYSNGVMRELDRFAEASPSRAAAINNPGQIVGTALLPSKSAIPWIWDPINGSRDLTTFVPADSGWSNIQPTDINDHGEIVGTGVYREGDRISIRGFILVPPAPPAPAVNYLPLAAGAQWKLRSPLSQAPVTITVTEHTRGISRIAFSHPWGAHELSLVNQFGKVYLTSVTSGGATEQISGETLYFDLTAPEGTEWSNILGTMRVASRTKTIVTPHATYTDCVQIWAHDWSGNTTIWTFAPGVGFVQFGEQDWAFTLEP